MGCRAFALLGCLGPRWCSGCRAFCSAGRPLCVPVGGGPPASRPRRELRSARRLEARPGPAAAHRHCGRSLRRPPRQWGQVADVWLCASSRCPARPRHRPPAPRQVPSAPSMPAALCRWRVGWCVLLQTSSIQGVFCVDFRSVVTNVVNLRAFSLIMVVFGLGLTTFVTGVLVRRFELHWFDDVCNVGRPLVARPGPAAAQ